jgi:hypothetical protein
MVDDFVKSLSNPRYCATVEKLYSNLQTQLNSMDVKLVVYDETEQLRIDDKLLTYPFNKRKSYVGPPIKLQTRNTQLGNYPPYVYLDHRDRLNKPSVKMVNLKLVRSYVDMGIQNFMYMKSNFIDKVVAFFLIDERNIEAFEPFKNDYMKLQFDGYDYGEYTGQRDDKYVASFEDLFVFKIELSDDIMMSRRQNYSHFDMISAVGGLAIFVYCLLAFIVKPINKLMY